MASNTQRKNDDPNVDQDQHPDQGEDGEEPEFITEEDILEELPLDAQDGDEPMEEDDELGDLPNTGGGSSADAEPAEDNSVQLFRGHKGSVFAVSCHPTQPLAASGGEDDIGYIWDITDGEIIVKLTGHTDSVTATAWSNDGEMIATGGMDGKVRIWRRVGREKEKDNYRIWEFLTELQGPDEVMVGPSVTPPRSHVVEYLQQFLRWHPKGNVLLAGSNDSTLWLWQRTSPLFLSS